MGALYLFCGNLHRVADIPRRWPIPPRGISLPRFRHLLRKRNLAISQFSSRNPNAKPEPRVSNEKHEGMDDTGCPKEVPTDLISSSEPSGSALNDCKGVVAISEARLALEGVDSLDDGHGKKELIYNLDSTHEKEEKKCDFEQKLHVLNEKKHHLMQMLKQKFQKEVNKILLSHSSWRLKQTTVTYCLIRVQVTPSISHSVVTKKKAMEVLSESMHGFVSSHAQSLMVADLDPQTAKFLIASTSSFLSVFGLLFILRIVMSWYPKLPVGKLPYVIAYAPTEPFLDITRKVIPPLGGVDVTPVVWFGLVSFLNEILVGPQGLLVLLSRQV